METRACVCLRRLHASALLCRRMDAAVKTSKCGAQINDIGQETIKESNRVLKIREGDIGGGVDILFCLKRHIPNQLLKGRRSTQMAIKLNGS